MKRIKYFKIIWRFPFDLVRHMRNESHRGHFTTYLAMRKLYVLSKGRSRALFSSLFGIIRGRPSALKDTHASVINDLKRDGVCIKRQFIAKQDALKIRKYLEKKEGVVALEGNKKAITSTIESMERGLQLRYSPNTLLSCEKIVDLISDPTIVQIATDYLGCKPVFAGVNAR